MSPPRIAFIGLGRMGLPMAAKLVAAGHTVAGFDVVSDALVAAAEQGVSPRGSLAEAVDGAEVIVTMLPSGEHLRDAYVELLPAARAGGLALDCSTVDIASARFAHEAAQAAGLDSVDAPVSGGVIGAETGSLTFMAGGEDAAIDRAEPLLARMGKRVVRCGPAGSGQVAKLANNMILGASMLAVSEAFVLAERLGVSHEALFAVASTSSGQCWALTTNCPVPGPVPTSPANRDYTPGFSAELMLKDLTLAQEAAQQGGAACEVGALALDVYHRYVEDGGAGTDFSGVVRWVRERSSTDAKA